jgi:hypothetical protein
VENVHLLRVIVLIVGMFDKEEKDVLLHVVDLKAVIVEILSSQKTFVVTSHFVVLAVANQVDVAAVPLDQWLLFLVNLLFSQFLLPK